MCMEDFRIGRKIHGFTSWRTIGNSTVPLIGPATDRVSLLISSTYGSGAYIGPNPDVGDGTGYFIFAARPALELDIRIHGDLVRMGWYAFGLSADEGIWVMESFLDEQ